MRSFFLVAVAAIFLITPALNVMAQSPEMPVPHLVIKDADGKTIAPVVDFLWNSAGQHPIVVFSFAGESAGFVVSEVNGHFDSGGGGVSFSEANCTGDMYINPGELWENWTTVKFEIVGPDRTLGTYRVFRSTSQSSVVDTHASSYDDFGSCENVDPGVPPWSGNHYLAEEILPNPLEGFHGPTTANPERLLTVEGGTRLP